MLHLLEQYSYMSLINLLLQTPSSASSSLMSRDSSVGIATRKGLDGQGSNPGGRGEIFRTCPDRPRAHPASYTMGTVLSPVTAAGAWR